MAYRYFSHNGQVRPLAEAVVPLERVEYSYGFGVYETVRLSKGRLYFLDEHCGRLLASAAAIGLEHHFTAAAVAVAAEALVAKNQAETCNLKILLIGGATPPDATLDILCLNPLFPDRTLYRDGTPCITYRYEREFPQAKTLNMLSSYLAYRQAKTAGAYDALLINRDGCITEGTRTNFFALKGRTLLSPKAEAILPGVTRRHVLTLAREQGFEIIEQDIARADLAAYDGALLTSTSAKIMPIRSVDDHDFGPPGPATRELMAAFDRYLDELTPDAV